MPIWQSRINGAAQRGESTGKTEGQPKLISGVPIWQSRVRMKWKSNGGGSWPGLGVPIWQSQSQESRSANERGVLGEVKLSEPGCAYMAKPGQQLG